MKPARHSSNDPYRLAETKLSTDRPTKLNTNPSKVQQWRRKADVDKLMIDDGVYIFAPLKLGSYWTDVHQIFTRCSQIIYIEPFEIEIAIFRSV